MIYGSSRSMWEKYKGKWCILYENEYNTGNYRIQLIQRPWNRLTGLNGVKMSDNFFVDKTHIQRFI